MNFSKDFHKILIALLIGFGVGLLANQWYAGTGAHPRWRHADMRQHMLKKFSRELGLSVEQKEKIAAIFDAKRPKIMALKEEMQPKFKAIRQSAHDDIRAALNEEQQKKFDEMTAKMEERWQKHGTKWNS